MDGIVKAAAAERAELFRSSAALLRPELSPAIIEKDTAEWLRTAGGLSQALNVMEILLPAMRVFCVMPPGGGVLASPLVPPGALVLGGVRRMIEIIQGIRMAESKLRFTSSRSACPGVRNVNKVSTRPTLLFDLAAFPSRAAGQKEKIRKRLASRTA